MKKLYLTFFFTICWSCLISAQSVFGKWKTFDIFDKNKEEAIVEISIRTTPYL